MLKAAGSKGVSKSEVANALSIKENSVPVYFFGMKKLYKAEIETVKQGRQVIAYKLLNADAVASPVPQHRGGGRSVTKPIAKKKGKVIATKATKSKATKTETPKINSEMEISEISDSEFFDIKSQLGLV
jgi:hypothetical protein